MTDLAHLEAEILKEHSKRQANKIALWVGSDKRKFRQLMELFLRGEYRVTQRSAWSITICSDRYPALITPRLSEMLKKVEEPGVHDAVKRNVFRILRTQEIPRSLLGKVAALCFDNLEAIDVPIAVRVHSMYVLANIAGKEPEIGRELQLIIEKMLPYSGAGIRACGRKALKRLSKNQL